MPPKKKNKKRAGPRGRRVLPAALDEVRALLGDAPRRRDLLVEHLHLIQDHYRCISDAHLVALAAEMKLAPAEAYEVASFYHHFDVVKDGAAAPPAVTVRVCDSVSCELAGCEKLIAALENEKDFRVQRVPCVGRCDGAPVAVVGQNPVARADADTVRTLAVQKKTAVPRPDGSINLKQYRAGGGYQLAADVAAGKLSAEKVIAMLDESGLRGLGGAGFPAGRKWNIVRAQPAPRLMAVNLDEGEPGTFKDRFYLERDPHRFLEGMLVAAHAAGIVEIYIYVRDEYPACLALLRESLDALAAAPPCTLPQIHLRRGAGAYICGEESAMIESIEGKRG
ncbi:MAG: NAD(P)H-dependent oxidoreductase subunit E, partial [Gammaproteobacteria bacterium]|nr:NAD(P)H-dependent oxidoreductase subunit E [Gammaproteobacteria bacterium]